MTLQVGNSVKATKGGYIGRAGKVLSINGDRVKVEVQNSADEMNKKGFRANFIFTIDAEHLEVITAE
jgi:transcription antitermination factor NusG